MKIFYFLKTLNNYDIGFSYDGIYYSARSNNKIYKLITVTLVLCQTFIGSNIKVKLTATMSLMGFDKTKMDTKTTCDYIYIVCCIYDRHLKLYFILVDGLWMDELKKID